MKSPLQQITLILLLSVFTSVNAITYTWKGSTSTSWAVAANWTPTRTTPATTDDMVITPTSDLTITSFPTQTIRSLTINGTGGAYSVTMANGNNSLTITTLFDIEAGNTLDIGSLRLNNAAALFSTSGSGTLKVSNTTYLPLSKTWSFGLYVYGSTLQTIQIGIYNNITINSSIAIGAVAANIAGGDVTINGTLSLINGILACGTSTGSITGASSSSYIYTANGTLSLKNVGTTAKLYPVGTLSSYTPLTIKNNAGNPNITVKLKPIPFTNAPVDATKVVNLEWSVLSTVATTADITYQFNTADFASAYSVGSVSELGNYKSAYTAYNLGIPAGSNPYTVSATGMSIPTSGSNNYVIGNTYAVVPVVSVPVSTETTASALSLTASSHIQIGSTGSLIINQLTEVNSITLAPGAKLNVGTNTLTATNGITLQSSASATATLIDNYENPTITATVEQYLPQGRNWYVASPIETNTANTGNLTTAGASSVSYYSEQYGWQHGYSGSLAEGVGYIAVSSAGTNTNKISFNGKLNSGDVPVTLTKKGSTFAGYNLIANPYPSYINPMTAINANPNLDGTIWYRTRKTVAPYEYKFETVNTTSGVGTNAAGTGMVTGYVPPLQAFWVRTNADMQPFTFTNSMRDHARNVNVGAGTVPTTPLKVKNQDVQSIVRIKIDGNAGSDEAVLYFNTAASNGYDKYDSQKMFESETIVSPEIFTQVGAEKLVINGLNAVQYNSEIPLGFIAKQAGDYSISSGEISNFEFGTKLILKDKLNPTSETELSEGVNYNFSSQITEASTNRFSLLFRAPGVTTGIDKTEKSNIQVFVNANNQITIIAPEKATYNVYNAVGQLVSNGKTTNDRTMVNTIRQAGVYVVKLTENGTELTTRVIIK